MAYTRLVILQFGTGQTGLATVGYALYNNAGTLVQARTTTGVAERGAGTGTYGVSVAFPDNFEGELRADTGGASPKYLSIPVHPGAVGAFDDLSPPADIVSDADMRNSLGSMVRAIFNRLYNENNRTASQLTVKNDAGVVFASMSVTDNNVTAVKGKST